MKALKYIILSLFISLLFLPLAQQYFGFIEFKKLEGAYVPPGKPEWNNKNWKEGIAQDQFGQYFKYNTGFRPFLIRLHNQTRYNLYSVAPSYIVVGKQNQFFSWDYWSAYYGLNFIGADSMQTKMEWLSTFVDSMEVKGKTVLCVIAPNKVRYIPETLPNDLSSVPGGQTNYDEALLQMERLNIPYTDLNKWFLEMKDTVQYPLFANTSTHWSGYGMNLGMQRTLDELEQRSGKDIINLRFDGWDFSDHILNSDRDMVDLMNLLEPIKTEPLAYPNWNWEGQDSAKPAKALIVGDSFFWNYYAWDEIKKIFDERHTKFWYYNNTQMDLYQDTTSVRFLSERAVIEDVDFVIFLGTEANMHLLPYGFPKAYFEDTTRVRPYAEKH